MINFVNHGTDEAILKSLPIDGASDDLIKAMGRQGLVQKEVQVRGKNGKIFTRKQWVKTSETSDGSTVKNNSKATGDDKILKPQSRFMDIKETKNADSKDVLEFSFKGEKYQAEKDKTFTFTVKTSSGENSKISGPLKFGDGGYARVGSYPLEGMDNVVAINSKCKVSDGGNKKQSGSEERPMSNKAALSALQDMDGWDEDGFSTGDNDSDVYYAVDYDADNLNGKIFMKTTYGAMCDGEPSGKLMTAKEVLNEVKSKK